MSFPHLQLHYRILRHPLVRRPAAESVILEHGDQCLQRSPVCLYVGIDGQLRHQFRSRQPLGIVVRFGGYAVVDKQVFLDGFAQAERLVAQVQQLHLVSFVPVVVPERQSASACA